MNFVFPGYSNGKQWLLVQVFVKAFMKTQETQVQ
jgi:hypothetical protein